jgi:predicted enzyme related to lactoylglutathione lyase
MLGCHISGSSLVMGVVTTTRGGTAVLEKGLLHDIRTTVAELKSRGVEFASDVLEFPWGYVAQFQDPDGNRLQLGKGREGQA